MELSDMLHPMLELSISIPAIILCFLPMKNHLNGKGKLLLLWGIPTLILWCVGVGWLCWRLRYSTKLCMLLTQALLLLFYCKAVPLSRWKTVNVFLAVCGVFSSMYNLAILIDAILFRRSGAVALSLNSTILYVALHSGAEWHPQHNFCKIDELYRVGDFLRMLSHRPPLWRYRRFPHSPVMP